MVPGHCCCWSSLLGVVVIVIVVGHCCPPSLLSLVVIVPHHHCFQLLLFLTIVVPNHCCSQLLLFPIFVVPGCPFLAPTKPPVSSSSQGGVGAVLLGPCALLSLLSVSTPISPCKKWLTGWVGVLCQGGIQQLDVIIIKRKN